MLALIIRVTVIRSSRKWSEANRTNVLMLNLQVNINIYSVTNAKNTRIRPGVEDLIIESPQRTPLPS